MFLQNLDDKTFVSWSKSFPNQRVQLSTFINAEPGQVDPCPTLDHFKWCKGIILAFDRVMRGIVKLQARLSRKKRSSIYEKF